MSITRDEVMHVANLARLEIDEKSMEKLSAQIEDIMEYIDVLKGVDARGVPATSHAISLVNAFREDEEKEHLDREKALSNAPDREEDYFLVPKIIG